MLWDMEQDFGALRNMTEEAKVTMAAMYLDGSAKLWWRTKMEERTFGMVDARSKRGTSERPS